MLYTIRKALPDDIQSIIELCVEHAAYEVAEYQPEGKAQKLSELLFCANPQLHCILAIVAEDIVGYATFSRECSTWNAAYYIHLDCLYLKQDFRGLGIGEALLRYVEQFAKQSQAHHVEWQTPVFNTRAIKFYHRIGASSKEKLRFTLNFQTYEKI